MTPEDQKENAVVTLPSINHVLADIDAKGRAVEAELKNLPWTASEAKRAAEAKHAAEDSRASEVRSTIASTKAMEATLPQIPEGAQAFVLWSTNGGEYLDTGSEVVGVYRTFDSALKAAADHLEDYGYWVGDADKGHSPVDESYITCVAGDDEGKEHIIEKPLMEHAESRDIGKGVRWHFDGAEPEWMDVEINRMNVE